MHATPEDKRVSHIIAWVLCAIVLIVATTDKAVSAMTVPSVGRYVMSLMYAFGFVVAITQSWRLWRNA